MPLNAPRTLQKAVDLLVASLDAEERDKLRAMKEEDLISLHLGLGMWMRNSFPIWGNDELLRSIAVESRPRLAASVEKLLAEAQHDPDQVERIRKFFGPVLAREWIEPDDASGIIIHEAWERLQREEPSA